MAAIQKTADYTRRTVRALSHERFPGPGEGPKGLRAPTSTCLRTLFTRLAEIRYVVDLLSVGAMKCWLMILIVWYLNP